MRLPHSFLVGASGEADDARSLATLFEHGLDQHELLCRELEDMADSLPGRLNTHQAVLLMGRLRLLLQRAHLLEENLVFPALIAAHLNLKPVLDRLCAEHAGRFAPVGSRLDAR